jgi:hypothetical protein
MEQHALQALRPVNVESQNFVDSEGRPIDVLTGLPLPVSARTETELEQLTPFERELKQVNSL